MILKFWPRWPQKQPRPPDVKISKSSSFYEFSFRIFIQNFHSFLLIHFKNYAKQSRKELGKYFQRLHFWNQWVPLIKMHYRVRYSLVFDLKIRSGQVCWDHLGTIQGPHRDNSNKNRMVCITWCHCKDDWDCNIDHIAF